MRRRLPDPNRCRLIESAIIAFGAGILASFFLSAHILALIEAILIIAVGVALIKGKYP